MTGIRAGDKREQMGRGGGGGGVTKESEEGKLDQPVLLEG